MLYIDASALVKLVLREPEAHAIERAVGDAVAAVSIVGATELLVVSGRGRGEEGIRRAEEVLTSVLVLDLDLAIARSAARIDGVRTLDAIHLATALGLAAEIDGFLTYDRRLAAAAEGEGLRVLAPA